MKLSQGLSCLEFQIMSSYINIECTNPDLSMKDAIDRVTISNCGFKFQNATHTHRHCQAIWGMARQSSSAVGICQFCYRIIIIER